MIRVFCDGWSVSPVTGKREGPGHSPVRVALVPYECRGKTFTFAACPTCDSARRWPVFGTLDDTART